VRGVKEIRATTSDVSTILKGKAVIRERDYSEASCDMITKRPSLRVNQKRVKGFMRTRLAKELRSKNVKVQDLLNSDERNVHETVFISYRRFSRRSSIFKQR